MTKFQAHETAVAAASALFGMNAAETAPAIVWSAARRRPAAAVESVYRSCRGIPR
ncbi:hypothetical protein Pd630_LPD03049 [Rhodococcus opacus PD630]|nr:hypothetical protein Pd630_LPD03049 [Rhodococcus opacus PD630]